MLLKESLIGMLSSPKILIFHTSVAPNNFKKGGTKSMGYACRSSIWAYIHNDTNLATGLLYQPCSQAPLPSVSCMEFTKSCLVMRLLLDKETGKEAR